MHCPLLVAQAKKMRNYQLNINNAVDKAFVRSYIHQDTSYFLCMTTCETSVSKVPSLVTMQEYEGSSLTDIAAAPTSALQGVAQKGRDVLKLLGQQILTAIFARKLLPVVRC